MSEFFSFDDLQRSLPGDNVVRGRRYLAQGRVSRFVHSGRDRYQALVQGSRRQPYQVDVRLVRGKTGKQVYGLCSCPMRVNCKHVAAVLLRALQSATEIDPQPRPPGRGDVRQPSASTSLPGELRDWLAHVGSTPARPEASAADYPVDVVHRLLYLLVPPDGGLGGAAQVHLMLGRHLTAGGYSDVHPWAKAREAAHRPPGFLLPQDLRILRMLLLDAPPLMGHSFALRGEAGAAALHAILATGRCHLPGEDARPLSEGPPRSGTLHWAFSTDGGQHIVCDSTPAVQHLLPLAPPWYIDVTHKQCGPLNTGLPDALAEVLTGAPEIAPEHAASARDVLSARVGAQAPLPEVPAGPELREVPPAPHLRLMTLRASPRSYRPLTHYLDIAVLTFDYAGLRVGRDSPGLLRAFQDGHLLHIKRDARAERRAHELLERAGFKPLPEVTYEYPEHYENAYTLREVTSWPNFVCGELPRLRAQGWQVELDEGFRFRPAQVGEWTADIAESGEDWFELSLGVEVDGERWDVLPILLSAIRAHPDLLERPDLVKRSGARHDPANDSIAVALEGGRVMSLPLARVRPLLSVMHELVEAGLGPRLRLARLDATRLADLEQIADLKWKGGEKLRRFGARLAGFSGIESVPAPLGLRAELRSYQMQGLAWLQFLRGFELAGILADDMGLGKTVQALAHVLVEKEAGRLDRPALVVAPTSVVANWQAEVSRFAPHLRVHVSHGLKRKGAFGEFARSDIVLTSYALLARDKDELIAQQFHLVILDEAQQIKNARTQAARVVQRLQARHRLCLTGTPLENHLGELWSLFHFLLPGFLGDTETFRRQYRTPIEKHADQLRRDTLARRIRPFVLRRTKEQVAAELPLKSEIVETVELTGAQSELYETVRATMHERVRAEIAARGLARSQILVLDALLKLRQICCDPRLLKLDAAKKVKESAKLARLIEMLEQLLAEDRRVLLFSQFTSMLELIEAELKGRGIGYVKLTGDTRDRRKPVDAFQRGKAPLFLISLKAGGTGLNLTAADTVIHYDPWWNPAVENQATDRAHRIGQDKPVFVYKLIAAGSVEQKIAQLQARKAALASGVLVSTGRDAQLTREDIAALFEPIA